MKNNRKLEIGAIVKIKSNAFPRNPLYNGVKAHIVGKNLENPKFFLAKIMSTDIKFLVREEDIAYYEDEYIMENNSNIVRAETENNELNFVAYEKYNIGDYIVVKSDRIDFALARVTEVENVKGAVEFNAEAVCKVDMTAYNDRKAREKRKAELKGKMEAKVKELQETAIFEMLAKEDVGLAEMLKEFKELG